MSFQCSLAQQGGQLRINMKIRETLREVYGIILAG
jgi:hypothetical protein